jgi:hypothetical protein
MVLPWFVRSVAIRTSQVCGEIYTTETFDGSALWMRPGCALTFGQMVRIGIEVMPFELGLASFRRYMRLVTPGRGASIVGPKTALVSHGSGSGTVHRKYDLPQRRSAPHTFDCALKGEKPTSRYKSELNERIGDNALNGKHL